MKLNTWWNSKKTFWHLFSNREYIFHISAHLLRMFVFVVKVQIRELSTHSWHTCKCEVTLTCENISYFKIEQENSIKKTPRIWILDWIQVKIEEFWVRHIRIGNKKTDQKGISLGTVLTNMTMQIEWQS